MNTFQTKHCLTCCQRSTVHWSVNSSVMLVWLHFLESCFISQKIDCKQVWMMRFSPPHYSNKSNTICLPSEYVMRAYSIQVEVFMLVWLLANTFPHLLSFSSATSAEDGTNEMTGRKGCPEDRGVPVCMWLYVTKCVCVHAHTHLVKVMRIGANWWCNLFHPPSLCSALPLAAVQPASATVFYTVIYHHLRWNTRICWPHFHPVTSLPQQN